METIALHDRIKGCLAGVALGDALGMPWETCAHDEIVELTAGRGVRGLEQPPEGSRQRQLDPRGIAPGQTTDDWQLSAAVALSLVRSGGFHLFDQAAAHVEAYEQSTKGWGGSTREAMAEIKRWFDSRGREGRRPDVAATPGPGRGEGNGVMMRVAPLVCAAALVGIDERELRAQIDALGRMSHSERVSADVGAVMRGVLLGEIVDVGGVLATVRDVELGGRLRALFANNGRPPADEVRRVCGTSFRASESAAFCLSTWLRWPGAAEAAVLEAINAGGDTDTNASIVGALSGASGGAWPQAWLAQVPDAGEAGRVAEALIEALSGRGGARQANAGGLVWLRWRHLKPARWSRGASRSSDRSARVAWGSCARRATSRPASRWP